MSGTTRSSERGMGAGVLVGILALLVIGGVGFYLWSDPFRTKTNEAFKQMSEWTPENIAKDPINYLNFCEEQTNLALEKLKTSEISIAQKRGQLVEMRSEADGKIKVGDKALAELKAAYTAAAAAAAFPVTWSGKEYDKESCQKQIIGLDRQVKSQRSLHVKIDGSIKKLDIQKQRVIDQRAEARKQLTEIQSQREVLKVQQITDDLTTQLVDMKSVLQTVIATADESSDMKTLDDLAAESASSVDQEEFDAIMNEK
ncbi:MAG: hypothetical protein AAGD14_07310 [Planctomycetota bacterium]